MLMQKSEFATENHWKQIFSDFGRLLFFSENSLKKNLLFWPKKRQKLKFFLGDFKISNLCKILR